MSVFTVKMTLRNNSSEANKVRAEKLLEMKIIEFRNAVSNNHFNNNIATFLQNYYNQNSYYIHSINVFEGEVQKYIIDNGGITQPNYEARRVELRERIGIVSLTQAEYDALDSPDPDTMYFIEEEVV